MKYDFWLELPQALGNIIQDNLTKEEQYTINLLTNSSKVKKNLIQKLIELTQNLNLHHIEIANNEERQVITAKLNNIEMEKNNLIVQAIKTSTKLMTRINHFLCNSNTPHDVLIKIKLFLKISRIVIENVKEIIRNEKGQKAEFFQM
jgi:hypothetical protein